MVAPLLNVVYTSTRQIQLAIPCFKVEKGWKIASVEGMDGVRVTGNIRGGVSRTGTGVLEGGSLRVAQSRDLQ